MGACSSVEGVSAESSADAGYLQSRQLDRYLAQEERRLSREVKMLLLGPGSSGKSTILKQMKLIHLDGFNKSEIESYRQQIFVNVLEAMTACLKLLEERAMPLQDPINESYIPLFLRPRDLHEREPFPANLHQPLQHLWNDASIQSLVLKSSEAVIPENMPYFFSHLDRLFDPSGYAPTELDVLHCRQRTTGITETAFRTADLQYRLYDVGGQRSERRKWVHLFEDVTAILFLVSLSGYNQPLLEDRDSNQMQEALMLFDSICNSQWFQRTSIVLFLNKLDIFKQKILLSSVKSAFPDYEGDESDYIAAREYFKDRFLRLNRSQSKQVYAHFTTAIDTNLVRVVMASVYDIILARNLNEVIL